MKLLHSADWHLDSPLTGRDPALARYLRAESRKLPEKIAALAVANRCQALLLSGDIFDGPAYTRESLDALYRALETVQMPVFIAPGNHDPYRADSPWCREPWPGNVHIFQSPVMERVFLPELDCLVYGAGFTGPEAYGILEGFHAVPEARYTVGVVHGDPLFPGSPNNAVTAGQIGGSGLTYLALGHIHKRGDLQMGGTLCAWPGCPMGRGFDELERKGALLVTLAEGGAETAFLPLDTPAFYDWKVPAGEDPAAALASVLPAAAGRDVYRVSFTGACAGVDLAGLRAAFSGFPYLELRDQTVPPLDIWGSAGEDTLEGIYFDLLQSISRDPARAEEALLAAQISRQILNGQEVTLP